MPRTAQPRSGDISEVRGVGAAGREDWELGAGGRGRGGGRAPEAGCEEGQAPGKRESLQVKIKQNRPRWDLQTALINTATPSCHGTVKQAPRVMKGKIFYSDLLI